MARDVVATTAGVMTKAVRATVAGATRTKVMTAAAAT
jgi:hypothetical protein